MGQYSVGTVDVTINSQVVTGTDTLWSTQIEVGDSFGLASSQAIYSVGSINSDTQLSLTANYVGTTQSSQEYFIQRDFTINFGWPYPGQGDINTATTVARSLQEIDDLVHATSMHNSLGGLQGGTTTSRYHLSNTQHDDLVTDEQISELQIDGTPTYSNVILSGVVNDDHDATPKGYVDSKIDDAYYALDSSWSSEYTREKIAETINDLNITLNSTWSSSKIDAKFNELTTLLNRVMTSKN